MINKNPSSTQKFETVCIESLCRLDNRSSIRATFRELEVNVAYRWFRG